MVVNGSITEFSKAGYKKRAKGSRASGGRSRPQLYTTKCTGQQCFLVAVLGEWPGCIEVLSWRMVSYLQSGLKKFTAGLPEILAKGASLLAISPQNPDNALTMKEKNSLGFEVLSDSGQQVIRNYGLQFDPGEDYHRKRDLSALNGDGSLFLPLPATFIIDQDFVIQAAHVEANYTQRMEPNQILEILNHIKNR